jgi:hypothetical protein
MNAGARAPAFFVGCRTIALPTFMGEAGRHPGSF